MDINILIWNLGQRHQPFYRSDIGTRWMAVYDQFVCHYALLNNPNKQFGSASVSVHAGVRVAAQDRAGRERLLRYCARPMFAGERPVWAGGGAQVR